MRTTETLAPLALAAMMVAVGVMAVVTPASAGPSPQLSDTQFLAAARCAGIAKGLGADASAYEKVVQDQDSGREAFISDRAGQTVENAIRDARHAGPDTKAHMNAELGGACRAFAG